MNKTFIKKSDHKTKRGVRENEKRARVGVKDFAHDHSDHHISRNKIWNRERTYELLDIVDNLFDIAIG